MAEHCFELKLRSRQYGRRLEQCLQAQSRHPPGHPVYEAARRKAQIAARVLESLCDQCPYAGQEGGKPCDN